MFSRIHFPRIFSTPYEKKIDDVLQHSSIPTDKKYKLLALKKQSSKMANGFFRIDHSQWVKDLEQTIDKAISAKAEFKHYNSQELAAKFDSVKKEYETGSYSRKLWDCYYLAVDVLVVLIAGGAIAASAIALSSGPMGWALIAIIAGLTLPTALLAYTSYNMYMEVCDLMDKPLKDIEEGIEFLNKFPAIEKDSSFRLSNCTNFLMNTC